MPLIDLYSSSHAYTKYYAMMKGGTLIKPESMYGYGAGLASTGVAEGLCADFGATLDGMIKNLGSVGDALNNPFGELRNELNDLVGQTASPINDLTSGLDDIKDGVTNGIPSLPDVSDIDRILQECLMLNGSILNGVIDPLALANKYLSQMIGLISNIINGIVNGLLSLIEAPIAALIGLINNLLSSLGIGNLLSLFDGLINCIEAICGRNFDLPTIPDVNSHGFPPVQGYDSITNIEGFPNVVDMVKNVDFEVAFNKAKKLVSSRLPDLEAFDAINIPEFPDVTKIPGYPYITDMVKNIPFKTAYDKVKQVVSNNIVGDLLDEAQDLLNVDGFPGVSEIPGYPDIAEMTNLPAFKTAFNKAKELAQVNQVPYLEYIDDSIEYVNNLLNDLNLNDKGEFDLDAALADVPNVPTEIIDNIKELATTISDQLVEAEVELKKVAAELESGLNQIISSDQEAVTQTTKNGFFS